MLLRSAFSDSAPENPPKITRTDDWCAHGAITATTGECVCSTHLGYFCEGESCQSGFGMSFFHHTCKDCECAASKAWLERKKTYVKSQRRNRAGGV